MMEVLHHATLVKMIFICGVDETSYIPTFQHLSLFHAGEREVDPCRPLILGVLNLHASSHRRRNDAQFLSVLMMFSH